MVGAAVLHVDADAFFAAVEQALRPELRGRPIVVGGGIEGRGVVASASYEARAYGLSAGMPIQQARALCPDGAFLAPRFEEYNRFSEQLFELLTGISPAVEQVSLDDAYVDLAGCRMLYGAWSERPLARLPFQPLCAGAYLRREGEAAAPADRALLPDEVRWLGAVALWVKRLVRGRLGLDVSVGAATNRAVAKAASKLCKPDGLALVAPGAEADFTAMLALGDLPGIGPATLERLRRWNVRTVPEARRLPLELLEDAFGADRGEALFRLLRGEPVDPAEAEAARPAGRDRPRSIARETTFWTATTDYAFTESILFSLVERLGRALRRQGLEGRTVQVKVRYQDFATVQCSRAMGEHADRDDAVFAVARRLLAARWCRTRRVRLVGVGLTDLRPARLRQVKLFDDAAERSRRLDRCLDELRERFGSDVVRRGPAIGLAPVACVR